MENNLYDFGMIGLGTMGRNLLLNMADHGFRAIGFDKDLSKGQLLESSATPNTVVKGVGTLAEMVSLLQTPRKIMMLVPAGKPVDSVIQDLLPLLGAGDIVIDGGNSHYTDTLKRLDFLKDKGFHFMGIGISGGEHGARTGPSIMPGGNAEAYAQVETDPGSRGCQGEWRPVRCLPRQRRRRSLCEDGYTTGSSMPSCSSSAKYTSCCTWAKGLGNDQLHKVFKTWNEGELQSYLVEITRDVFMQPDDKTANRLVDMILDKAGSKGTGKWTSQDSMDLGIPVPVIDMAVSMRDLSAAKDERTEAAALYKTSAVQIEVPAEVLIQQLGDALYFSMIICYAQGMAMLHRASADLDMQIPLTDVVKIWRGGCIIRSSLLETFYTAYQENGDLKKPPAR